MPNPNKFIRAMEMIPSLKRPIATGENAVKEAALLQRAEQRANQLGALGVEGSTPSREQILSNQIQPIIKGEELQAKIAKKIQEREAQRQLAKLDTSLADLPVKPKMDMQAAGQEIDDATKAGISLQDNPELAFKAQAYERNLAQNKAKAEALERMKNKPRIEE